MRSSQRSASDGMPMLATIAEYFAAWNAHDAGRIASLFAGSGTYELVQKAAIETGFDSDEKLSPRKFLAF